MSSSDSLPAEGQAASPVLRPVLKDKFGREVTYIRISVTDRCDFRCTYCMGEDVEFLPRDKVLSLEEIHTIASAFVEMGVSKIRITGGEPLVRKNLIWLLKELSALEGLEELVMTTNGSQLTRLSKDLVDAGVSRLNISLDTLDRECFAKLARRDKFQQVMDGIDAAREAGFKRIKLNAVIQKGVNEHEIMPLVNFALSKDIDICFIEEMPLGEVGYDRKENFISSDEVREIVAKELNLADCKDSTGGPAKYFKVDGGQRIGFISPHSHNFCGDCNRVRLTVEGRLLLCLGNEHSMDLRQVVRDHPGDVDFLKQKILEAIDLKPLEHHFNLDEQPEIVRFMNSTGG
ncbi:GTP 3',8-cyclase MoaA [Pelagibaculum spongiae]|uniref:GTP 3',8-cyclase n=2 Tax=Pelagibaculum spongiae TaxID=2080658 RepID=A0A2V1GTI3_9GAMM|nr:GTP 3',8-cyclase MoaA [Pelagibaculum spongiae]PVZ65005.1 GTP 3',8-cyclase MoaA [Pelagibaculum spongiae]